MSLTFSRNAFLSGTAAAGAGLAIGVRPPPALAAITPVRVTYIPVVDDLPLFVGIDQGFFKQRNLDLTATLVANQGVIISSLTSNSAEIGTSVLVSMLPAVEAGIPVVAIGACVKDPIPPSTGVLARTGSGIKSAGDLLGKKVGVATVQSFSQIVTVRWLDEKHVDTARVTWVEAPFPQMADLLKSGQLDAVVAVDPFFHRIVEQKIGYVFDDYVATIPKGTIIDCYASLKGWAQQNLPVVHSFLDGIRDAIAYIRTYEADARESLSRWTKQPPDVVASTLIPDYSVPVTAGEVQWWINLAKKQGVISSNINPRDLLVS